MESFLKYYVALNKLKRRNESITEDEETEYYRNCPCFNLEDKQIKEQT